MGKVGIATGAGMKTTTLDHKRGDTFIVNCTRTDTDITDWTITSQIRDYEDVLIVDCDVTITDAAEGQYTVRVDDTTEWPVGSLLWDIQCIDTANIVKSTDTVKIRVVADITRAEA